MLQQSFRRWNADYHGFGRMNTDFIFYYWEYDFNINRIIIYT